MIMATQSHAQAVKSFNNGPGRRRFVFKTFSQRIEEIDVDVFRSLDPVNTEPSNGSSFFLDCLNEWRELNTAEDFISFYNEMFESHMVQTLPQIIQHHKQIIPKLLSRLDIKGRLSLEPILRLIAELSRDILELFNPYLGTVVDKMVLLLSSGADREPEIIQQIFTSWSQIMMYLQKYMKRNVVKILKVTRKLRFYPKGYIQELMAKSMSSLLRIAPDDQLEKGVKRIIYEVVKEPSETIKSGTIALLYYTMKGFSSTLHSKAERVLCLLLHNEVIGCGDKDSVVSNPVVEVLISVIQRLCEDLKPSEFKVLLKLEAEQIDESIANGNSQHVSHLVSVFISTMQVHKLHKTTEFEHMLELAKKLVEKFIMLQDDDQCYEVMDEILQLMLCIVDDLHRCNNIEGVGELSLQWAPIFENRSKSLLTFIKELSSKDIDIVRTFRTCIVSALTDLLATDKEESMYLLIKLFEKLQPLESCCLFEEKSKEKGIFGICAFLEENITRWNDSVHKDPSCVEFRATDLAWIWGVISCYSYIRVFGANPSLLMNFVDTVDHVLMVNSGTIASMPRRIWESLIGAGLNSYTKLSFINEESTVDIFLHHAKKYKSSVQILSAVADMLDLLYGSSSQAVGHLNKYHSELTAEKTVDAFNIFSENLYHSDKQIRHVTLRILCHYESLDFETSAASNQPSENDMIIDVPQNNVLHLLLEIEATTLSIDTSRKVDRLIKRIQRDVSSGTICRAYIPLVFNFIIGLFHNQFNEIWEPAKECFVVLVSNYYELVWDICMKFLENCMTNFISHQEPSDINEISLHDTNDDLHSCFNAYVATSYDAVPSKTLLFSLIRSLQKVKKFPKSGPRHIITLILKFLGYEVASLSRLLGVSDPATLYVDSPLSVGSYNLQASNVKHWKSILEDWLNLLKSMNNTDSFYENNFLKEVLQFRLLDENDPKVQSKVLDCLLIWEDKFLVPYEQHLKNLVHPKTNLKDELTRWSLSKESHLVSEQHRDCLVPFVIRLLVPKVRKLKTLGSTKPARKHLRKAVIGFLAELDISELPLFFALLLKPLQSGLPRVGDDMDELLWSTPKTSPSFNSSSVLRRCTMANIKSLSSKKIYGFLHVCEEIVTVFDESRIDPFLDTLMGSVVCILATCAPTMDEEDHGTEKQAMTSFGPKQLKDLRSLCLKIISLVLNKFKKHDFKSEFWDIFFSALKPLIDGFKQEGASSKKPRSLFVCFLAMSRSQKLVSLFDRAKNLVPDIFSILTVATASEAIISCVLSFIENLVNLDNELGSDDVDVKGRILVPNIDILVSSLHQLFTCKNANRRRSLEYCGRTELSIFKLLPKYITNSSNATKFIDILLPFLTKKPHDWDSCLETLHVIKKMAPMLESEGISRILKTISPLFIHATSSDVRLTICDILDDLSKSDPSLVRVANLLRELSASSPMEIDDDVNYEVANDAYQRISIEFFSNVRKEHALIILSRCVYDMSSQNATLKNGAYKVLVEFVDFCRKILCGDQLVSNFGCWTKSSIQNTTNDFILKYMGDAMNKETSVKKVWFDLLREMVSKLPTVSDLGSYDDLCNADFFNDIIHIQQHMRGKALSLFRDAVRARPLSQVVTNKVIVPLLFKMLLVEVKQGKGQHLIEGSIKALGSISGSLGWNQYYALLNKCLKQLNLKPDNQKLYLQLIYSILDGFHFSENETDICNIQTVLTEKVLPRIQKLLTLDTDSVNVNVSLVALKLFKLLPGNQLDLQLPTIIDRIVNFLKSPLESVRDEARSALVKCLKELGLEYFGVVLNALRSTLKRGFQLHVLGFTLNYILSKSLSASVCGTLDYCLDELLSVVENDILGDVSDKKDVKKIASKMKETRHNKSFETLALIAQSITFNETNASMLMSPVTRHLENSQPLPLKLKSKLVNMLNHIAFGIKRRDSKNKDILIFAYGCIKDGVNGRNQCCSHLITVFALKILRGHLKIMNFKENEHEVVSLLDPFVGLLCNCLSSNYEEVKTESIDCLSILLKVPLPSLDSEADKIKDALFSILLGSVSASGPLVKSGIRLLTDLLRSTKSVTLSIEEIQMLPEFPLFVDLERNPTIEALSLLKEIVKKMAKMKVRNTKINDLANKVAELMVTSEVESIRKKCSEILLLFLYDKELSSDCQQQHLDSLLANLRYEHPSGREAVLEMLHAIIIKFSQKFVKAQSQTLFFHLIVCLTNDSEKQIRSMTATAIKRLIGRVGSETIFNYTWFWYSGEKQGLWSAAAQGLGLLVEVMKEDFEKHIDDIFVVMRRIFSKIGQTDAFSKETIRLWKEAYFSLVLFEKILLQFPELLFRKDLEDMWEHMCDFLLHPHIWVRNISSRIFTLYFNAVDLALNQNDDDLWSGNFFIMRPSRLFLLAVVFCSHLKTSLTDDSANYHLGKNINFAVSRLHSMLQGRQSESQNFFDPKDEEIFVKAFVILDSRKGGNSFASLPSGGLNGHFDRENCENYQYLLISSLLKKMGKIALDMEEIQMSFVLNSFKNLSISILDKNEIMDKKEGGQTSYAYHLLLPFYKICEGFVGKVISDDGKQHAEKMRDRIRDVIGNEYFNKVYNQIRKNLKDKRDKRKHGEKIMAVVNPMRNAKRKLRIAEKHKQNKKRKIIIMKSVR